MCYLSVPCSSVYKEPTIWCGTTVWWSWWERTPAVSESFGTFKVLSSLIFQTFLQIIDCWIDPECRYHMDPSGTFVQCDARAIGSASEGAQSSLQDVYHKVKSTLWSFFLFLLESCVKCIFKNLKDMKIVWFNGWNFSVYPCVWLAVHDIKRCHKVVAVHPKAGDGGEAQCYKHWGLFLMTQLLSEYYFECLGFIQIFLICVSFVAGNSRAWEDLPHVFQRGAGGCNQGHLKQKRFQSQYNHNNLVLQYHVLG